MEIITLLTWFMNISWREQLVTWYMVLLVESKVSSLVMYIRTCLFVVCELYCR